MSFNTFFASHQDALREVISANGYHFGWNHEDHADDDGIEITFRDISATDLQAQLYEADVKLELHNYPYGISMPEVVFLEFVTHGPDKPWILMTAEGSLYSLGSENNQARLPIDLHVGIRDVFERRAEVSSWWTFRCKTLHDLDLLGQSGEAKVCRRLLGEDWPTN